MGYPVLFINSYLSMLFNTQISLSTYSYNIIADDIKSVSSEIKLKPMCNYLGCLS